MYKDINRKTDYSLIAMAAFCFVFSAFGSLLLLISTVIFCVFSVLKLNRGIGAAIGLLFITIRSIVNPGIAVAFDDIGLFKWAMIFILTGIIYLSSFGKRSLYNKRFLVALIAFLVFEIISSLLFSGYPIVSIFKLLSWSLVFIAIILVVVNNPNFEWIGLIANSLNLVVIFSPVALLTGDAFLRNGHAFQGIVNHPNMLGIIVALTFTVNLYLLQNRHSIFRAIMSAICFMCGIFSESRTSIICMLICFVLFICFSKIAKWKKWILVILVVFAAFFLLSFGFGGDIQSFFYKGVTNGNILYSRQGQIDKALLKYNNNKWFGSGFMVPYNSNGKSFSFSFDLVVEPGNLILALLGDIGIIGLLFFSISFCVLFFRTEKKKIVLFLFPFIASMGEMMFFSTNNIAVLYYFLLAICMIKDIKINNRSFRNFSRMNEGFSL